MFYTFGLNRFSNGEMRDFVSKISEHRTTCSQDNVNDDDSCKTDFHEHYDAQIQVRKFKIQIS